MLAVLGRRRGLLVNTGLPSTHDHSLSPEEEDKINNVFDKLYESLPRRQRGFVQEHISIIQTAFLGIAWAAGESTYLMEEGNVTVFLIGSIDAEHNCSGMDDVEYILNEYRDACDGRQKNGWKLDTKALAAIKGNFSFLIYDKDHDRMVVFRDGDKIEGHLYYGRDKDYGDLIFSDDANLMKMCKDVESFPTGHACVYTSLEVVEPVSPLPRDNKRRRLAKVESVSGFQVVADA